MKKRTLIITLIIIVVLVGTGIFIFRERPLIPEGYSIQQYGGTLSLNDEEHFSWEAGRTMIEYNPDYPNGNTPGYSKEYLTISTDELEAILKTAKSRVSLEKYTPYFLGSVKYSFNVVLVNGDNIRHVRLCLGLNSWESGRTINYSIKNAEALMEALDAATSIERIH